MVFSITNLHRFLDCHTKPCSNRRGRNHRPWWNGSWSYRRLRRWKGPKSRQWHGPKIPFLLFLLFRVVSLYKTICVTSDTKLIDPKICYCCVYLLSELCNLQQLFRTIVSVVFDFVDRLFAEMFFQTQMSHTVFYVGAFVHLQRGLAVVLVEW